MFQKFIKAVKAFFATLAEKEEQQKPIAAVPAPSSSAKEHLVLLALLQKHGRFIDFLKEDISSFSDEQVGAVAKQIHRDCKDKMEEWVTIRPAIDEEEDAKITIPQGYNPAKYKLTGNVIGEGPYQGVVRHSGWKACQLSLPKNLLHSIEEGILVPAEIEILKSTNSAEKSS